MPRLEIQPQLARATAKLPVEARMTSSTMSLMMSRREQECLTARPPVELSQESNEAVVFHGTPPDHVLDVATRGFNERFAAVGAFGNGNYCAEDAGKSDQYVKRDDT